MEKINFKHSIIFFNFCILISPLYLMLNFEPIVFCLFLILILGISHGALDNIKGSKLLKLFGYKNTIFFYFVYIFVSLFVWHHFLLIFHRFEAILPSKIPQNRSQIVQRSIKNCINMFINFWSNFYWFGADFLSIWPQSWKAGGGGQKT